MTRMETFVVLRKYRFLQWNPTVELYILNWNINLKEPMLVDVVS